MKGEIKRFFNATEMWSRATNCDRIWSLEKKTNKNYEDKN